MFLHDIVNAHDIGVVEADEHFSLVYCLGQQLGVAGVEDCLDRDRAALRLLAGLEVEVEAFEYRPHAAPTDQ